MTLHTDSENLRRAERAAQHLALASRELAQVANGGYRLDAGDGFSLSPAELSGYDLGRALRAVADPAVHGGSAKLEMDVTARAQRAGLLRNDGTLFVPFEVLMRDLNTGAAAAGGNLLGKDIGTAVGWLRPGSTVLLAGATSIEGLTGNFAVPRFSAGGTVQLIGEGAAAAETDPAFDQVVLTPKTVSGFVDYSRKLGLQTADRKGGIAGIIAADLSDAIGSMVDAMALAGSGAANEPTGILNTVGVGSVPLGVNGGPMTWDAVADVEYAVGAENGTRGALGYVTNPKVKRQLQKTQVLASGLPIWSRQAGQETIAGTPAWATTNVPNDLVKGTSNNCSALIYGNWANVVLGLWGRGLELIVNPYSQSTSGTVRITALLDFDVALRRAATFAVVSDIQAP
jgi:HK97 family phage major capsid protein